MNNSIKSLYSWYTQTLRNPRYRWWIILGTVAYLFSPFDIAPDFFPIVGQVDDMVIVTLLMSEVFSMVTEFFQKRKEVETVSPEDQAKETVDVDAVGLE
jgi:uncharacterized membrane protein YkvA (DUF1232 family)